MAASEVLNRGIKKVPSVYDRVAGTEGRRRMLVGCIGVCSCFLGMLRDRASNGEVGQRTGRIMQGMPITIISL